MKNYLLLTLALLGGFASCKDDETVNVIRGIIVTNDGQEYTAPGNRLMYIFDTDGKWVANYDYTEKFLLNDGTYRIVCVKLPAKLPTIVSGIADSVKTNLEDMVLKQMPDGTDTLTISNVVTYRVPGQENLRVDMTTRTGRIRFVSRDTKPDIDNSYNRIRSILKVKRIGYKVSDGTYIAGDMDVIREQSTNAGIGVKETFAVFPTEGEEGRATLVIEYYKDEELVAAKTLDQSLEVQPGMTTLVEAYLNDPDPRVIGNFDVTITDEPWTEDAVTLSPSLQAPNGTCMQ